MEQRSLAFLRPMGWQRASGGNVYNREVLRALEAAHPRWRLEIYDQIEQLPKRDAAQRQANANTPLLLDSLDLALAPRLRNWPLVLLAHYLPSLSPLLPAAQRSEKRAGEVELLQYIDRAVAVSPFCADALVERGMPESRIAVIAPAPGVVPGLVEDRTAASSQSVVGLKILVVANLVDYKGVGDLLVELSLLLREGGEAAAAFAGRCQIAIVGRSDIDSAYAESCRRIVRRDLRDQVPVRFYENRSAPEMARLYREHDVLVSASFVETYGMAVQEALDFGLPVFAREAGNLSAALAKATGGRLRIFKGVRSLLLALSEAAPEIRNTQRNHRRTPARTWAHAAHEFAVFLNASSIAATRNRPGPKPANPRLSANRISPGPAPNRACASPTS